ncbi:MAG: tyrosine-type recombinase/integrase [Candidatus Tumulicola sp.]
MFASECAAQNQPRILCGPCSYVAGRTGVASTVTRYFHKCIKRAKVTPITLQGLRDTHASLLAKAGAPIEVISQRLGHASIAVTAERYLHVYRERDRDAATAFGRLVG